MKKWIGLLFLGISFFSHAQEHLKYVAQGGDGIIAVLRKYELEKANCNLQYFFKINDLRNDNSLILGAVYQLPIQVYTYNGSSIRSTIDNDNMALAKEIQTYNERMVLLGLKHKSYTENKELWVPHSFLACDYEKITKPVLTEGKFPIFGPDYANIDQVDSRLNGWVFYVVAGHGGPDPGAVTTIEGIQTSEDEYAYDISLRLARNLIKHGATAYMITRDPNDGIRDIPILHCDEDEYCYPKGGIPLKQITRLRQRAGAINKLYSKYKKQGKKQLVITIHIDSRAKDKRVDMFFYHHPKSSAGKRVAQILHTTIKEKYDYYNPWRGYDGEVTSRDLFMLRETHPTSVYIELGNIQNEKDQDRFIIVSNREAVAEWLKDGLLKMAESN